MDEAPRTWVHRLPLLVLAVLAAGFLALGVAEARADAPTFDEPVYVSAGLAAVLHHDVTLNDEHPPLAKVLAVLPVLFEHPVVPANGRWSGNVAGFAPGPRHRSPRRHRRPVRARGDAELMGAAALAAAA